MVHDTKEFYFRYPEDIDTTMILGRKSKSSSDQSSKADIVYNEALLSRRHASITFSRKKKHDNPVPGPNELLITIKSCKEVDNLIDVQQGCLKRKLVIENGGRFGLIGIPSSGPDGKIKPLLKLQVNVYIQDASTGLYQVVMRDISTDYLPFPAMATDTHTLPHKRSKTYSRHFQTPERSLVVVNFKKHNKHSKHHRSRIRRRKHTDHLPSVPQVLLATLIGTVLGSMGILGAIIYFGDQLESML